MPPPPALKITVVGSSAPMVNVIRSPGRIVAVGFDRGPDESDEELIVRIRNFLEHGYVPPEPLHVAPWDGHGPSPFEMEPSGATTVPGAVVETAPTVPGAVVETAPPLPARQWHPEHGDACRPWGWAQNGQGRYVCNRCNLTADGRAGMLREMERIRRTGWELLTTDFLDDDG